MDGEFGDMDIDIDGNENTNEVSPPNPNVAVVSHEWLSEVDYPEFCRCF